MIITYDSPPDSVKLEAFCTATVSMQIIPVYYAYRYNSTREPIIRIPAVVRVLRRYPCGSGNRRHSCRHSRRAGQRVVCALQSSVRPSSLRAAEGATGEHVLEVWEFFFFFFRWTECETCWVAKTKTVIPLRASYGRCSLRKLYRR